jgi:hypothetical protein
MTPPKPDSGPPHGTAAPPPLGEGLPRSVPTLTLYANGFINLNLEATLLLCSLGKGLDLQPPPKPRPGRTPGLWQILPGQTMPFLARRDRGNLRCWAGGLSRPAPGRYALTPIAGVAGRYCLLPV